MTTSKVYVSTDSNAQRPKKATSRKTTSKKTTSKKVNSIKSSNVKRQRKTQPPSAVTNCTEDFEEVYLDDKRFNIDNLDLFDNIDNDVLPYLS